MTKIMAGPAQGDGRSRKVRKPGEVGLYNKAYIDGYCQL